MAGAASGVRDRGLTGPNALSVLRLVLLPGFLYLLFVANANGWAGGVLMFSGSSHWAAGRIRRPVANPTVRRAGGGVEAGRRCVRMGVLDVGHGHVSVVGGAVPGPGGDGGAATAQGVEAMSAGAKSRGHR